MVLDGEELYNKLFSKVNGTKFDREEVPDLFTVTVVEGEEVLATWDITEEIAEHGMGRLNFTGDEHDVQIIVMNNDFKDALKDDELFQQAMEWNRFNGNASINITYYTDDVKKSHILFAQGSLILIIGLLSLAVRLSLSIGSCPRVVKVTRSVTSVWCIITGILLLVCEGTRTYHDVESREQVVPLVRNLIHVTSEILLKSFMVSLKIFTVIVYIFQNTMIYRPFFFRQYKKVLSRWVLFLSLGQSAVVVPAFIIWSMVLILYFKSRNCAETIDRTEAWRLTMRTSIVSVYIASLFLSFMFKLGYYRKSAEKVGSSERKTIKRTMIACSMEILFDASALIAKISGYFQCLVITSEKYDVLQELVIANTNHCELTIRLAALDMGLPQCLIYLLVMQPAVQELFLLIAEIVEYCTQKNW